MPTRGLSLSIVLLGCRSEESAPPSPEPELLCRGKHADTEDGEVARIGSRILDAQGRVLEESETDLSSGATFRIERRYEGALLLEERFDDGDGFSDGFRLYDYDDRGRLVQVVTVDSLFDLEQRFEYDEADQLIRELTLDEGVLTGMRLRLWAEGRVAMIQGLDAATGEVQRTSAFTYLAPSPALDHEERLQTDAPEDPGWLWRRTFDSEDRLLTEDAFVGGEPASSLAQTWDEEGRLIEQRSRRLWWDHWSSATFRWVYGEDGLLESEIVETDVGDDGLIDARMLRQWSWTCAP